MKVSIIILNYNGKELLEANLPSVIESQKASVYQSEIILVDNGSVDDSVCFTKTNFPRIKLILLNKNYGFGEGYNKGIPYASGEVIILLNNDMRVERNFINPLVRPFEEDPNVFAVGSQIFFQDDTKKREETGKTFAFWDKGILRYSHQEISDLDIERKYIPVFWVSGGSVAYNRNKFLELGGFRNIYSPAYVEDADISYQAMKRGWKNTLSLESVVFHMHRMTSNKMFSSEVIEDLNGRNRLLFIWLNIRDMSLIAEHLIYHSMRIVKNIFLDRSRKEFKIFFNAIKKYFSMQNRPARKQNKTIVKDVDLIKNFTWKSTYLKDQNRFNVLFVCPYVPGLNLHAGATAMYHRIKGLSKKHDVSVLTFIENETEIKSVEELKVFCKSVKYVIRNQYFDEPDLFHIKPNMVIKEFCKPDFKKLLVDEALSGKYDLIQFEYLQTAYLERYIRNLGIKTIWVNHEVQHAALKTEFSREKLFSWNKLDLFFRNLVMLNFELSLSKRIDFQITVTEHDKEEILKYLPNINLSVVPHGVDTNFYVSESSHSNENIILFTGYYLHKPNIDAAIYFAGEIFPKILSTIPDAKFYIVGSNPDESIRALQNQSNIFVTGWVPDLRPYLNRASVFVAPIRLGMGMRGKILEALSMGIPVVTTSLAARGLEIREGMDVFIADEPGLFAENVISVLTGDTKFRSPDNDARKIIEKYYSWDACTSAYEKIIEDAIQRS